MCKKMRKQKKRDLKMEREARKTGRSSPELCSLAEWGSVPKSLMCCIWTGSDHLRMVWSHSQTQFQEQDHVAFSSQEDTPPLPMGVVYDTHRFNFFLNPVTFFNSHPFFSFPMYEIKKYLGKQCAHFYKNNLLSLFFF